MRHIRRENNKFRIYFFLIPVFNNLIAQDALGRGAGHIRRFWTSNTITIDFKVGFLN